MQVQKTVFVSYSGRSRADKIFATRLLVRLKDQGFAPWVYEQRGEEIAAGSHIDEACRRQIRKSDLFVCIISDSSLASPFTAREVELAVELFDIGDIFQVATTTQVQDDWPEPYRSLLPYKHVPAVRMDETDLERVLFDLCRMTASPYSPPSDKVPKLPLIRRLTQELGNARPARRDMEVGLFERMIGYAMHASTAYDEGRKEHAVGALDTLQFELEREYPEYGFYYPRLAKAAILLELAPLRRHYLNKAEAVLDELATDASIAAMRDENLYAAQAVAALHRKESDKALALFRKANDQVTARGELDLDILHNIAVASLAVDDEASASYTCAQLDMAMQGSITSDTHLIARATALRAALLARSGDDDGAVCCLDDAETEGALCLDILCRIAQELSAKPMLAGKPSTASHINRLFDIVAARGEQPQRNEALLSQAAFHYRQRRFDEALQALDSVDRDIAGHSRVMLEQALIHLHLGHHDQAKRLLAIAADSEVTFHEHESAGREKLYYRGYAAWLIGHFEQARRDFLDSRFSDSFAYDAVAGDLAAMLAPHASATRGLASLRPRWLM
jgi:tetratricopeptide (TPR) repeat protein